MSNWWLRRRDTKDQDLNEELQSHLDMAVRDRVEQGQTRKHAEDAARRQLGNMLAIKEATREMWGGIWIERAAQDLRYAARLLRRSPAFTFVAVLSLALGIGANTAIFQVIDAVRLRPLPVRNPGELAEIRLVDPDGARGFHASWHPSLTHPIWEQIQARQEGFSGPIAWSAGRFNLASGGESRPADGLWVSGGFFSVLGIGPAIGRVLTTADDQRGCAAHAVISYPFWQRQYGGNPSVLGQTLTVGGHTAEIVGVSAAGFFGLEIGRSFDVALPLCADSLVSGPGRLASGTDWWLTVMGRLEPGGSLARATAQLNAISPALFQATLPPTYPAASVDKYLNLKLAAYDAASGISALRENYEAALWLLLGTAALVLLIACANLANLLLARASARQREIAVRLGLGASRGRIIRQLLTESLLLASVGAACGALLAGTLSRTLISFLRAADQTVVLDLGTDWRVLAFAAGLGLMTCGLFGLAPALKATGIGASAVLKAHGRGMTASPERVGLRRGLVVGQVALSLVLLVGALLFARSFYNLVQVDPGFHGDGLLIAEIDLRQLDVVPDGRKRIRDDVMAQLRGIPGVQSAAQTAIVPISGNAWGNDVWVTHQGERKQANAFFNRTSPDYFHTLGIPLVGGRDFDDAIDTPSSPPVAIVNEAFARALLNGASPVGTRFSVEATPTRPERSYDIVGVIRDAKYMTLREEMWPGVFLADSQSAQPSTYLQVLLRSTLPSDALAPQVTRRLADINPRMIVTYTVMTSQIADTLVRERLMATLSGFFGALAAILTLVGLYGVIAYTVARRTNEIGVRMALGANRSDVITMILREAGVLVLAGMAVGLLLAVVSGQAASTLLFGLEPTDPLTLGVAIVGLSVVALLASYAPARAAARIEPINALRIE